MLSSLSKEQFKGVLMNIDFYYIKGINREDTRGFDNITFQKAYFKQYLKKTIESVYYPPFYKNTIRLNIEDVNLDTNVNYVGINYNIGGNDKYFYYFIDNIRYISEGVIEVTLTLDSIQTYYFDIVTTSNIIERQTIKRWSSSGVINRNYIRENVSQGTIRLDYLKVYSNSELNNDLTHGSTYDYSLGMFVLKLSSNSWGDESTYPPGICVNPEIASTVTSTRSLVSGTYYYFAPGVPTRNNVEYHEGDATHIINPRRQMLELTKIATGISLFYFPFNPVSNDEIRVGAGTVPNVYLNITNWNMLSKESTDSAIITSDDNNTIFPQVRILSYQLPFISTNLGVEYTSYCEVSLLDDNYINVTFGENEECSQMPLFETSTPTLNMIYWADITSGSRFYTIVPNLYGTGSASVYTNLLNKWNQVAICNNPITVDLVNDEWKQWKNANRASIGMQYVGLALQCIGGASASSTNGSNSSFNVSIVDKIGKKKIKEDTIHSHNDGYSQSNTTSRTHSSSGQSGSGMLGVATSQWNAWLAPKGSKTVGSAYGDISSKAVDVCLRVYKVDDFDKCAQYYNMYGNLVMRPIYVNGSLKLLTSSEINKRYIFDYVKMYSCIVELDCLEVDNIRSDIEDRLKNGIRIWHNNVIPITATSSFVPEIGNYYYNNIDL